MSCPEHFLNLSLVLIITLYLPYKALVNVGNRYATNLYQFQGQRSRLKHCQSTGYIFIPDVLHQCWALLDSCCLNEVYRKWLCFVILQCTNGHLMCAGCYNHLLADARLKDETATCPNCRCEINKNSCTRNLAVEKAVSELPSLCQYCSCQLPRNQVDHHQRELCLERWVDMYA